MRNDFNRKIWFVVLVILFGCLIGTCISMLVVLFLPDGVVKDFFIASETIGWGESDGNWIDLYFIKFKTGFRFEVSIISIFGMASSWYLLRYFR